VATVTSYADPLGCAGNVNCVEPVGRLSVSPAFASWKPLPTSPVIVPPTV
jgi:hypothetical protein